MTATGRFLTELEARSACVTRRRQVTVNSIRPVTSGVRWPVTSCSRCRVTLSAYRAAGGTDEAAGPVSENWPVPRTWASASGLRPGPSRKGLRKPARARGPNRRDVRKSAGAGFGPVRGRRDGLGLEQ
ncbi:hypothetical protein VNO78_12514 [Psophocarpus tetragonolobus]|uniref:Uncharacterized protein n=1 Tax=Psophocarpus tetragonolobus TaxID=3891 RepID=A0AAN9SP97_PSOTE